MIELDRESVEQTKNLNSFTSEHGSGTIQELIQKCYEDEAVTSFEIRGTTRRERRAFKKHGIEVTDGERVRMYRAAENDRQP